MDVKERKPYRSLTRRRDTERRYTSSSADSDDSKAPQKSYSSSETLKAYDQDSRFAYGSRVKDMVHQEVDEFCRTGTNFSLRDLGLTDVTPPHGTLYRTDIGLPHCGYSISADSDADTEADMVMSPEHPVRLWGRSTKSGRSSCLSSRANSNLTLTDTEHDNTENGEFAIETHCLRSAIFLRLDTVTVFSFTSLASWNAFQRQSNNKVTNRAVTFISYTVTVALCYITFIHYTQLGKGTIEALFRNRTSIAEHYIKQGLA